MPLVFINYRRDDAPGAAGRLTETLEARFGADEIFRDLDQIEGGMDFRKVLGAALRAARVMLVVIGRSWSTLANSTGTPRLHDPNDYVRVEIETALAHDLFVIPVLVEGARMPGPNDLPPSLEHLTFRNAHEISEARWHYDTGKLIELLERHLGLEPHPTPGPPPRFNLLSATLEAVARVPGDFLSLLHEPRRFLTERALGSRRDLLRAVVFLLVMFPIGNGLVLQEWPTRSSVLQFLFTPILLWLLSVCALSVPLYLSWRLAGAAREYRRVLIILLYQCAFVALGLSVAILVSLSGITMTLPTALSTFTGNISADGLRLLVESLRAAPSTSWIIAAVVSALIGLALGVWLVITWGAYRDALHQSRPRSLAALALFGLFCLMPLALVSVWLASLT